MKGVSFVIAFFASAFCVWAEPPRNIRTELLVVRVPEPAGLRLRPILREAKSVEKGVTELHAMIARGDADLLGAPVLWQRSGQRTMTETIEEIRYPTTFEWRSVPQNFNAIQPVKPAPPPLPPYFPFPIPYDVPFGFETRNVGVTLEFEALASADGRTILLNIISQLVTYEGIIRIFDSPGDGSDWKHQQPRFYTSKTTTSLTVISGEWRLLHVSVRPATPRALDFFLIRVTSFSAAP
jgi:hypothetical protein